MSNNIELLVQRLSSADSGASPSDLLPPLHGKHLADAFALDVKVKVDAASQLRDNLEHYISGNIYPNFLKKLMPIFINCLKSQPVFVSTSAEQVCNLVYVHRSMLISRAETSKLCT
jgi:transformation/transcription domain-associated protein